MATVGTVFDPPVVEAYLKTVLKGCEQIECDHRDSNQWLINWDKEWTENSVNSRCQTWINAGCVGSKEQIHFVAEVVEYSNILKHAIIGWGGKPKPLPPGVFKKAAGSNCVAMRPEAFLVEPVEIISSMYHPHLRLEQCPHPGCDAKLEKGGFMPTGFRTIYGLERNIKVIGMDFSCAVHHGFSTTSFERFWQLSQPWEISAGRVLGLDATIKAGKKANVYVQDPETKKITVSNLFEGGVLMGINEEGEMTLWGGVVKKDGDRCGNFNLRITPNGLSQPLDSSSRLFLKATKRCHHLFLIDNVLPKMEELTGIRQPKFLNICPEHHFGLLEEKEKLEAELKSGLKEEDCENEEWLYLWETTLNGCLDELQILEQENTAVLSSSEMAKFSSHVMTSHKRKSTMASELSAQPEDLFVHGEEPENKVLRRDTMIDVHNMSAMQVAASSTAIPFNMASDDFVPPSIPQVHVQAVAEVLMNTTTSTPAATQVPTQIRFLGSYEPHVVVGAKGKKKEVLKSSRQGNLNSQVVHHSVSLQTNVDGMLALETSTLEPQELKISKQLNKTIAVKTWSLHCCRCSHL
ncbi:hypothetical protein M422DRAFT_240044 [Sphaerobolus stellatus SS14]|nr:hypothetical protein M422DRAFT_240044 [Sphaerobolus stellatus SS14]